MALVEGRIVPILGRLVWAGGALHLGFLGVFLSLGFVGLAAFNAALLVLWALVALLHRRGRSGLAVGLVVSATALHAVLATLSVGWDTGFQIYLIPLILLVMFNERVRAKVALLVGLGLVTAFLWLHAAAPEQVLAEGTAQLFSILNTSLGLMAVGILSYQFRIASMKVELRVATMASTDALTGLSNRRHMHQRLHEEESRTARTNSVFSLILIDVDHFKRVNDTCGHDVGDRVLAALAKLAKTTLRAQDVVARWGGEEFLVLLPDTLSGGAVEVGERLRRAAEASLGHEAPEVAPITITLGVAEYHNSVADSLKRADQALYRGKQTGRNQVVTASLDAASNEATA